MNEYILEQVCILFMCDDPSNLSKEGSEKLEEYLNEQSRKFGFTDWIGFYHKK